MNAKLAQAFANRKVTVQKTVSGQVIITFKPTAGIENMYINDSAPVELTANASVAQLKQSNLDRLVGSYLRVV